MSATSVIQDNVKENLPEGVRKLIKDGKISRDYIEDGIRLNLHLFLFNDDDLNIILPEICNTQHPLRELKLDPYYAKNGSIEPGFLELVEKIANHTTLTKLHCYISDSSIATSTVLLKAIGDNRSIKHLSAESVDFQLGIVETFAQSLMNNDRLISLNLSLFSAPEEDHFPAERLTVGTAVQLAHALQTMSLQRLSMSSIDNGCFQALAEFLPKTLVHLDLSNNCIYSDSVPILCSYLKSSGIILKELILDDYFITDYLKEQSQSSSISTVKIIKNSSWQARFARNEIPLRIELKNMSDADWSEFFVTLTKDNSSCRSIHLIFDSDFDRNQLTYIKNLLSNQFQLASLKITGDLLDASIQVDLFQQLKENNFINELEFGFKIDSNVFNTFIDLLAKKTDITRLILSDNPNIRDEEIIRFIQDLKNSALLQNLVINGSEIGDSGFQALLSSLPNSLSELEVKKSQISAKSLPALLDFISDRPALKYVRLEETNISFNRLIEVDVIDLVDRILEIANANHCNIYVTTEEKITNAIINSKDNWIYLCGKQLQDDDILVLYSEFKKKPTRNWSLDITCNYGLSINGFRHLADILSSTINIVQLYLGSDSIDEEGKAILFNALSENKTLKTFFINSYSLSNLDMESIGRFIEKNPMLRTIHLQLCRIDPEKVIPLVKVLPESSLEELYLSYNCLTDRGCASLLSSIPPTLTKLSLANNDITESSLSTILSFLATNRTLKTLAICGNPITKGTICWQQVIQAVQQNKSCELN